MKTIVIGDIHGCYNELKSLISSLESNGEYNKDTDKLIFLGDYIDRGYDSRLVIDYIRNLQSDSKNVIALMGNHEDMLLNYFKDVDESWLYNGYQSTIKSYAGFDVDFYDDVKWMERLPLYHEDEYFVYVHAGIDLNKTMKNQDKDTLLWVREPFIYNKEKYYKRVIFGHTPTMVLNDKYKPMYTFNNNIDIDTGCVYGGMLTALIIEDNEVKKFYKVPKEEKEEKEVSADTKHDNKDLISIIAQGHYGNRTGTVIKKNDVDRFILGYLNKRHKVREKIDRTIIRIPHTENLVVVYNKDKEERWLKYYKEYADRKYGDKKDGHKITPLVSIPELGIEIYSRCIVCRMNEDGELESLEDEDFSKFDKYLAF